MSDVLEQAYGKKPILYVVDSTYLTYVDGHYADHKIWMRDILKQPTMSNREWLIWQYSNRGRVEGIETYVDKNVLNGRVEDLL